MPRTKTIPDRPRFQYICNQASFLLAEIGFRHFPISPWDVIDEYSDNIICIPWTKARNEWGLQDPFHLVELSSEARVIRQHKQFIIVYDDIGISQPNRRPPSYDRLRWTIMHELGHIFLFHLNDFDETVLDRGGLSDPQYRILEIEANCFAAEMFAPTSVFKHLLHLTCDEMMTLCDISEDAAIHRYRTLHDNSFPYIAQFENTLLRNFHDFFVGGKYADAMYLSITKRQDKYYYWRIEDQIKKCPSCHSFTDDSNARYCVECGYEFIEDTNHIQLKAKQDLAKSYSHYVRPFYTNEDNKLLVCPVCKNQEISSSDSFCTVCGQPLMNTCIKEGTPLSSECRHCPSCGSTTTFDPAYSVSRRRMISFNTKLSEEIDSNLLEYEYWSFVHWRLKKKHPELYSILFFSKAFLTDNEDLLIYVDDADSGEYIMRNAEVISDAIKENDDFTINSLEVKVINVL